MIFPPPPPEKGTAHGLAIKRAIYPPAMYLQQKQTFLINHIAIFASTLCVVGSLASTIESAVPG